MDFFVLKSMAKLLNIEFVLKSVTEQFPICLLTYEMIDAKKSTLQIGDV